MLITQDAGQTEYEQRKLNTKWKLILLFRINVLLPSSGLISRARKTVARAQTWENAIVFGRTDDTGCCSEGGRQRQKDGCEVKR
jgi:hypothetical protein